VPPVVPDFRGTNTIGRCVLHVDVVCDFMQLEPVRIRARCRTVCLVFYFLEVEDVVENMFKSDAFKSYLILVPDPVVKILNLLTHHLFTLFDDSLKFRITSVVFVK